MWVVITPPSISQSVSHCIIPATQEYMDYLSAEPRQLIMYNLIGHIPFILQQEPQKSPSSHRRAKTTVGPSNLCSTDWVRRGYFSKQETDMVF